MDRPDDDSAEGGTESSLKTIRTLGPLLSAGIQLAATVVVMYFLGRWLDGKFGTEPWLTIVCSMAGCAGGLISFIRTALEVGKSDSAKTPPSDRPQ